MRCHLFWTPLFYLYGSKKSVGNLFISGHSGLDSHHFQYMQNAHTDTCEHSLYLGK